MVPDEVIRLPLSHTAFRLYAVLLSFACKDGSAFPSNRVMCDRMGVKSVQTLRSAKLELVAAGLLSITPDTRDNGSQTSNLYVVSTVPGYLLADKQGEVSARCQGSYQPVDTPEGDPVEPDPEGTSPRNPPLTVSRRKVTDTELIFAQATLNAWNEITDQRFTSVDWIRKIVMRIREHPELQLADMYDVIRSALEDPWWDGPPSPSVVFGNGALFETALSRRGSGATGRRKAQRFGRGMTTADIIERGRHGG